MKVTITSDVVCWLSPSLPGRAGPRTPINSGLLPASFRLNYTTAPIHELVRWLTTNHEHPWLKVNERYESRQCHTQNKAEAVSEP